MFNAAGSWLRRFPFLFGAAGILLLVVVTYWPALKGQFVWDDLLLVDKNPLLTGKLNLATIWFRTDFPLSMVTLWLEWLVWGRHAPGFHVVNVLLHALGAILFWRVLLKLDSDARPIFKWGAWFAAVLFAVHPVAAASVVWISEIKNTLSLPFFLFSTWCFLRYEEGRASSPPHVGGHKLPRMYIFALLAFVMALLSKTSAVMLPAVLVLCIWWRRHGAQMALSAGGGRPETRGQGCPRFDGGIRSGDLIRVAPFFGVALVFGVLTMWFQHQAIGGFEVQRENFWARLAAAGRAVWFYLGKALLPIHLNFIYPRWSIDPKTAAAWIPLALMLVVFGMGWYFRRSWGRAVLFALGCFVVNLLPVLGFVDMYYLALSRVSDHFAYLALMPITALVGGGLAWLMARGGRRFLSRATESGSAGVSSANIPGGAGETSTPPGMASIATALIVAFAVLTFQRARIIANDEVLWRDTLAKNPAAWTARNNLGCILAEQGKYDAAIEQFAEGLQTNPRNPEAHCNLGRALAAKGRFDEAEGHFREALSIRPENADIQRSYGSTLAQQGKAEAALPYFREALRIEPDLNTRLQFAALLYQTHHPAEAVGEYRLALRQKPDHAEALNNLAWMLATSGDASVRNGNEAVALAERACALSPNNPMPLGTLAAAYAEAGRFKEAIETAQKAADIATRSGNPQFAQMNQQLLKYYRAGKAFHEPPAN